MASAQPAEVTLDLREPEVVYRLMLTFPQAADDFLGDCARRGFTPRTLDTYWRTYKELTDRLPRDHDVSKITTDDIRRYLATKTHLAPGTIAGHEAHLGSLFKQLYLDGKIGKNPMDRLVRTRRRRPEDLEVVTVDTAEVRRLLGAGQTWTERLAVAVPAYLGPRRHAIAMLRLTDYDELHQRIRFREKGGKIIWKPVPVELASLITAARADGAYALYDYIVPPEGYLSRKGGRDDRVIWRVIRRLADRVGIHCHVHALRAAFACFYDECNPGDVLALRDLMGHTSVKTTEVYLRRRDKEAGMERVRSLSWSSEPDGFTQDRPADALDDTGSVPAALESANSERATSPDRTRAGIADSVAGPDNVRPASHPQIAEKAYAASSLMGAGGFEPPSEDSPLPEPDDRLPLDEALLERVTEQPETVPEQTP